MRIIVDADACPVKEMIVDISKQNNIEVLMFCDDSHRIDDGYSKVFIIDQGRDRVDLELMKYVTPSDLVVTQDYGLACLVLGKGATCINQNGLIYTKDNIERLLFERFIGQKNRKAKIRGNNPKKRNKENDLHFEKIFRKMIGEKHEI